MSTLDDIFDEVLLIATVPDVVGPEELLDRVFALAAASYRPPRFLERGRLLLHHARSVKKAFPPLFFSS